MKTQILILIITAFLATTLNAQQQVTVNASNYDISDNLDLRAVAYLFGESRNLEEFERKLNDPEMKISNLDLNYDGYIDYLRVVEVGKNKFYVVTIQAVLGENIFQDVATIDVEVRNKKTMYVQVIGNSYVYGRNYIIEPVYVHRPVIIDFYVRPRRVVWVSPWYWGYYPSYYYYRQPHTVYMYHNHVHAYYGPAFKCHYVNYRKNYKAVHYHHSVHRNDWAKKQPDKSFENRNKGVDNHYELNNRRSARLDQQPAGTVNKSAPTNNRRTQSDWNSNTPNTRNTTRSTTNNNVQPAKSVEKNKSVTVESGANRRGVQNMEQKSERVISPSSTSQDNQQRNVTRTPSVEKKTNSPAPAKSTTVNRTSTETQKPAQTSNQPEKPKQATAPARRSEQNNSVNKSTGSNAKPAATQSTSSSARQQASPSKPAAEKSSSTRSSSPARSSDSSKSENPSSGGRR